MEREAGGAELGEGVGEIGVGVGGFLFYGLCAGECASLAGFGGEVVAAFGAGGAEFSATGFVGGERGFGAVADTGSLVVGDQDVNPTFHGSKQTSDDCRRVCAAAMMSGPISSRKLNHEAALPHGQIPIDVVAEAPLAELDCPSCGNRFSLLADPYATVTAAPEV